MTNTEIIFLILTGMFSITTIILGSIILRNLWYKREMRTRDICLIIDKVFRSVDGVIPMRHNLFLVSWDIFTIRIELGNNSMEVKFFPEVQYIVEKSFLTLQIAFDGDVEMERALELAKEKARQKMAIDKNYEFLKSLVK